MNLSICKNNAVLENDWELSYERRLVDCDSQVLLVVKNLPVNAGDTGDLGLLSRSGRSPGGGNGNPP